MNSANEIIALYRTHARKALRFGDVGLTYRTDPPITMVGSRIGGVPYLEDADCWPCDRDGRPLDFLLQVDFSQLRERLSFHAAFDLLVLFVGPSGYPAGGAARKIITFRDPAEHKAARLDVDLDPEQDVWYELTDPIAMWDPPDYEDLELLLNAPPPKVTKATFDTPEYQAFQQELKHKDDTRLGGFPRWLNGYHKALCPICNDLMYQVLQIDQLDVPGIRLGVGGCGFWHLLFCPKHPDQFSCFASPLS